MGLWVKLNFPASTFIIMQSCENLTSARCVHDGQEPTAVMAGLFIPQLLSPGIATRGVYGLDTAGLVD